MAIPVWMKNEESEPCPCGTVSSRRKDFVRKSIDGVLSFFRDSLESESFVKRPGLLQSLDPRAKLLSILALVIAVSITGDLRILAGVYCLVMIFALLSRIEPIFFIKRVWLFIPLFTGVIALPVIFNVFFPGTVVVSIFNPGPDAHLGPLALPETIGITSEGLLMAAVFTLRVAASVSAVVLLFLTTRQDTLFKSLRSIGVPKVYVLVMDMCYRYIFLYMDVVRDLYIAKKSRSMKSLSMADEWKWVGGRIGYTLIKTLDMSDKVHKAMMSRGFTGEVRIMHNFKMRPRDYCALTLTIMFSLWLVLVSQNIIKV